jgi:hypothetical protein
MAAVENLAVFKNLLNRDKYFAPLRRKSKQRIKGCGNL